MGEYRCHDIPQYDLVTNLEIGNSDNEVSDRLAWVTGETRDNCKWLRKMKNYKSRKTSTHQRVE